MLKGSSNCDDQRMVGRKFNVRMFFRDAKDTDTCQKIDLVLSNRSVG